jgi:Rps23 Pro-64 3,4-dihydroxylase Tpa1-like proline 4-hydroxylase
MDQTLLPLCQILLAFLLNSKNSQSYCLLKQLFIISSPTNIIHVREVYNYIAGQNIACMDENFKKRFKPLQIVLVKFKKVATKTAKKIAQKFPENMKSRS